MKEDIQHVDFVHIHCEKIITAIALANPSVPSPIYYFLFMVRKFKICSLSNFYIYNAVWLTVITTLYIRSPDFIHLITRSLYSLTNLSPSPLSLAPGNHHSVLCFYEFILFRFYSVGVMIQYLFFSDLFHLVQCSQGPSVVLQRLCSPYSQLSLTSIPILQDLAQCFHVANSPIHSLINLLTVLSYNQPKNRCFVKRDEIFIRNDYALCISVSTEFLTLFS